MVITSVFATGDEIKFKAGSGVSTGGSTDDVITQLAKECEAFVNNLTRTNFSTLFSTLDADVTGMLTEIETNYCAFFMIAYDMSGYSSIRAAEDLGNACWARYVQLIGLIKNQETVTYMKGVTI